MGEGGGRVDSHNQIKFTPFTHYIKEKQGLWGQEFLGGGGEGRVVRFHHRGYTDIHFNTWGGEPLREPLVGRVPVKWGLGLSVEGVGHSHFHPPI